MRRCILIVPYFGRFHNYFQLFLDSCAFNSDFDWIIFTDDERKFRYPSNVKVIYTKFETIVNRFRNILDFKICLDNPYKLCEYKNLYGLAFQKEINGYEFWGYCDVDLIFGKISDYITNDILENYDRVLSRGHLTLMRNIEKVNNMYKIIDKRIPLNYRYAFTTHYICHFDENEHWSAVAEDNGIRVWSHVIYADIDCEKFRFHLIYGNCKHKRQIFIHRSDGRLKRYYIEENSKNHVKSDEWCYIHLQKRTMKNMLTDIDNTNYIIVPNAFKSIPVKMNKRKLILDNSVDSLYLERRITRVKEIIKNIKQGALRARMFVYQKNRKEHER